MEEEPGTLSIKLKLTNGVDFEGSSSGPTSKDWLRKFVEKLYADGQRQAEDYVESGYPKKPTEELAKAK